MNICANHLSPSSLKELDAIVASHLGETFPALSLAVLHDGDWLFEASAGWIDPETQQFPVTRDTRFDLASVTKLFTESVFLQCISVGKARLDDAIVTVLPEFGAGGPRALDGGQDPHSKVLLATPENVLGQTADPARVTFRHLLTHTSAIAPWRDVFNAAGPAPAPPAETDPIPQPQRWSRGLNAICGYPFVGQPGDEVRYSDLGLMLLGEAAARLHGVGSLEDAVRQRAAEPLALHSVTFTPVQRGIEPSQIAPTEEDPTWRKRRCWGEVHDENACGLGGIAGHAGLFATASDIARFGLAWLLRDPALNIDHDLMDEAVREQRHNGFRFGLGWMLKAYANSSAGDVFSLDSYGHTGFTGTSLFIEPERRLVVACLTNRVYPGRWKEGIFDFRRAVHDFFAKAV